MKHLYFCRHGESVLNFQQTYAGQTDTPLTDLGRQQAKLAAEYAIDLHIDLMVSSPLSRTLETAQIIASTIHYPASNIITNDLFKERALGSLEGKPFSTGPENSTVFPDIETETAILARAQEGLTYLKSLEADTVLLVGHGSFVRALQTAIDPSQEYPEPPNAHIIKLI
jgi:uncharacterized phosphatase